MATTYKFAGGSWILLPTFFRTKATAGKAASALRKRGSRAQVKEINPAWNFGGLSAAQKRKHKGKFLVWRYAG